MQANGGISPARRTGLLSSRGPVAGFPWLKDDLAAFAGVWVSPPVADKCHGGRGILGFPEPAVVTAH
jgi:hypothetical protein